MSPSEELGTLDADDADDADDEDGYLAGAGVNVRGWEQNQGWRRCQVSAPAMHLPPPLPYSSVVVQCSGGVYCKITAMYPPPLLRCSRRVCCKILAMQPQSPNRL